MSHMKTTKLLLTLSISLAMCTLGFAQITGSDHDFSANGWSGGEICIVCHTPHNSDTSVADAPLWNHATTASTFTPYDSPSFDAVAGQPSGASKLCLSCHDGTVAVDSFGGSTGSTFISGGDNLGNDLTNDHPISFTYDVALTTADGGLWDPTTTLSGMPGGGTIQGDLLLGDQVQCSSCHDVHNGTAGTNALLRISNASSALCLTCHNK